VFINMNL